MLAAASCAEAAARPIGSSERGSVGAIAACASGAVIAVNSKSGTG
jgi:hypothetical protein